MNTRLFTLKISTLAILFFGYENLVKAQKDTIPPVISHCNDTFIIQIGSVWVEPFFSITDNQSDSLDITVVRTWEFNGPVNSLIRSIYTRTIEATDSNGNKTKCNIYYKTDDFIPPQIFLNTDDTICHKLGTPYQSVLPMVMDNYYPSNQISLALISSNVSPNVAGIYEERYQATDPSGNITYKIRYVIVSPDCVTASIDRFRFEPFAIYPNPVNDFLQIDLRDDGLTLKLSIVSMDGKVIFESDCTGQLRINTEGLADGVYAIIGLDGENVIRQKFVVRH